MAEPSTGEHLDDAMVRLADGDRAAIEPVYRALWPILVRYCTAFVGDAAEAEDLAQCALLKLFEQAHDYDANKPAEAWALAIAAWECRTYRRKRSRAARNVEKMERTQTRDSSPDVEQDLWQRRALAALDEIVSEMADSDQKALVDSFVRELSEPVHRKRKQRVLARLQRRWREVRGRD